MLPLNLFENNIFLKKNSQAKGDEHQKVEN